MVVVVVLPVVAAEKVDMVIIDGGPSANVYGVMSLRSSRESPATDQFDTEKLDAHDKIFLYVAAGLTEKFAWATSSLTRCARHMRVL